MSLLVRDKRKFPPSYFKVFKRQVHFILFHFVLVVSFLSFCLSDLNQLFFIIFIVTSIIVFINHYLILQYIGKTKVIRYMFCM